MFLPIRPEIKESIPVAKMSMWLPRCRARGVMHACGLCCNIQKKRQESDRLDRSDSVSCSDLEQLVDALNLLPNFRTAHPPRLTLPDHVHGLISLDRSPRCVEFTKALLGLHASFDRPMILLQDVVQVLDRSVAATAAEDSFLLTPEIAEP